MWMLQFLVMNMVRFHKCLQHIYPTIKFEQSYDNNTPEVFAGVVAFTFVLVAVVFFLYDVFVQRRQNKVMATAYIPLVIVVDFLYKCTNMVGDFPYN